MRQGCHNSQGEMAAQRVANKVDSVQMQFIKQPNQIILEFGERIGFRPIASAVPAKVRHEDTKPKFSKRTCRLVPAVRPTGKSVNQHNW